MPKKRVAAYVDGLNLYHAIANLGSANNHLKWINLRALVETYAPQSDFDLVAVKYFSAFAVWRPDAYKRHRAFVAALEATGVKVIMGNFKEKDRHCHRCGATWKAHEEKETDVNIAIHLLSDAIRDQYDMVLLMSGDSDLSPAVRMLIAETHKKVRLVFPIGLRSSELVAAAGGGNVKREMKLVHLQRSLFPAVVTDAQGNVVATRPADYAPPAP